VKRTNNYNPRRNSLLVRSLKGYLRFFRGILWLLAALGLAAVTGFLIVYPLWYFASGYKNTYSLFALGLLVLAAVFVFVRRLWASIRGSGGVFSWIKTRFFQTVKKILCILLAVMVLYLIILLFARGYILTASGIALVYIVLLGAVLAGRRESV
jgi:hypothetical protein